MDTELKNFILKFFLDWRDAASRIRTVLRGDPKWFLESALAGLERRFYKTLGASLKKLHPGLSELEVGEKVWREYLDIEQEARDFALGHCDLEGYINGS